MLEQNNWKGVPEEELSGHTIECAIRASHFCSVQFQESGLAVTKQAYTYVDRQSAIHAILRLGGRYLKGRRPGIVFKWNLEKLPEFCSTVSLVPKRRRRKERI